MKKILVIEDNEDNAFLFRSLLSLQDFELIETQSGREGIELAISEKPNLILMDIQLPDINGLEATKQIREALGGDVAILAVTSYAMTGDRAKCLNAGCNGYIEKPINPETFLHKINEYL